MEKPTEFNSYEKGTQAFLFTDCIQEVNVSF